MNGVTDFESQAIAFFVVLGIGIGAAAVLVAEGFYRQLSACRSGLSGDRYEPYDWETEEPEPESGL